MYLKNYLILLCVHSYFAGTYVCVKVLDPLKLELQAVVSYHVSAGTGTGSPGRAVSVLNS